MRRSHAFFDAMPFPLLPQGVLHDAPACHACRPTRVLASATKDAKRQEIMSKYKVWATTKFPEVQGISVAQVQRLQ